MYIPRINSGLKSEVLCLHKLHHKLHVFTKNSVGSDYEVSSVPVIRMYMTRDCTVMHIYNTVCPENCGAQDAKFLNTQIFNFNLVKKKLSLYIFMFRFSLICALTTIKHCTKNRITSYLQILPNMLRRYLR